MGYSPFSCGAVFFNSASSMPKAWTGNVCPQPPDFAAYPSRLKDEPRQGFKMPSTFAKRRNATYKQKMTASQSQILICDYRRTIFWTRKAFVWLLFFVGRWGAFLWYDFSEKAVMPIARKRCAMTGFYKSTIFLQLNTESRRTVKKEDCLFIFKNTT